MNKNNEPDKHQLDDLFARKLGNAVLPTNADGYARLQARMGQSQDEKKPGFVIWRNPNMPRALAIAACLLLVCLFGWLYLSTNANQPIQGPQVATTQSNRPAINVPETPQDKATNAPTVDRSDESAPATSNQPAEQIAAIVSKTNKQDRITSQSSALRQVVKSTTVAIQPDALAQNQPTNQKSADALPLKTLGKGTTAPTTDPVAAIKPVSTQRTLVVTIAEPERLVAARQAVKMEVMETALASASKPEQAAKPGFWEQIRRVKEGEGLIRSDDTNDERGLLNRAFSSLKNSIEKDKTARQ